MEEAVTIGSIAGDITTLVTSAISWVGSFVGAITGSPLLLMFVVVAFVGLGVGLISRIIHL